jgi:type II secretory pathway pseudopilin PulG
MSMTAKLVALGVIVLALLAGAWKVYHAIDKAGYTRAQAEYQAAAEAQRESNRGRTRVAEEKQAAQTIYRDRYITRTVKELDHAAQDLARCPVPAAAVRLLNDAARCAEQDRCPTGGAGDGVPAPG